MCNPGNGGDSIPAVPRRPLYSQKAAALAFAIATKRANSHECPDHKGTCSDDQTCCMLESGEYGCCGYPNVSLGHTDSLGLFPKFVQNVDVQLFHDWNQAVGWSCGCLLQQVGYSVFMIPKLFQQTALFQPTDIHIYSINYVATNH